MPQINIVVGPEHAGTILMWLYIATFVGMVNAALIIISWSRKRARQTQQLRRSFHPASATSEPDFSSPTPNDEPPANLLLDIPEDTPASSSTPPRPAPPKHTKTTTSTSSTPLSQLTEGELEALLERTIRRILAERTRPGENP